MTGLELTLYSGVPFNNKYKDVLLVSRETRETFLSAYSIGNSFDVNRFEIINDTEAIIDITNAFNGFECNYAKVHTTLTPETTLQTTERDTFYFVNSARQIATNVVRLTLEKDVFQTDFNKYDYQKQTYALPLIKNGRCILTGNQEDFNIPHKSVLTAMKEYNKKITFTPLYTQSATQNICYVAFEFTINDGLQTFCAITDKPCFVLGGGVSLPSTYYLFKNIIGGLQSTQIHYAGTNPVNMTVIHTYLIPQSMINTSLFPNLQDAYLIDTSDNNARVDVKYGNFNGNIGSQAGHYYKDTQSKTLTVDKNKLTLLGTLQNQIELPFNSQDYEIKIDITIASTFHASLFCNNQSIDLTSSFEISTLQNSYNEFMSAHQNGIAIKQIANVLNLLGAVGGTITGNPTSLLTASKAITGIAGDIAEFADLKNQPAKIVCEKNLDNDLLFYNIIGIFECEPSNILEIQKNAKYYGDVVDYLTNVTFTYKELITYNREISSYPVPVYEQYKVNFDYLQFANLELIAYLPENTKRTIEQMFLNGVRIWYEKDKFLTTIERETIITQ